MSADLLHADFIPPQCGNDISLVIVGSGCAALHLLSRLPVRVLKETVCIDESGQWLTAWKKRHLSIGTKLLRTPINHTPHKSPTALSSFAKRESRVEEIYHGEGAASSFPSVQLFERFCTKEVSEKALPHLRGLVKGRVVSVEPHSLPAEDGIEACTDGCKVKLVTGETIPARAVAYCSSPTVHVWPSWAQPDSCSSEGKQHPAQLPLIQHAADEGNDQMDLRGTTVVIVGGGMTGAQLALQAAARGALSVTLITRHKLCERALTCEVGWYGNKELAAFRANCDHEERLSMCQAARGCATINAPTMAELRTAMEAGKITLLEECEIASASQQGRHIFLSLVKKGSSASNSGQERTNGEDSETGKEGCMSTDILWLATGTAVDVMADPLLSQLQSISPTKIVGGYPVLDDATLAWPGLPLFLLGRTAMLSLGPGAGEMPGMRMGADRIVKCILGIFNGYGLPEVLPWRALAEQLGDDRGCVVAAPPYVFKCDLGGPQLLEPGTPKEKCASFRRANRVGKVVSMPEYTWSEDENEVCITIPVPEPIPKEQVHVLYKERELEVWAEGSNTTYHMHVPKLYSRILPERCKVKANSKRMRIYILLCKDIDIPWLFLKG